jgi:hypothetical protein
MFAQKALPHYEQTGKPKNFATEPALQGMMIGKPKWEMPDWKWEVSDTLNT